MKISQSYISISYLQQFLTELDTIKKALQPTKLKEIRELGTPVEKHVIEKGEITQPYKPCTENTTGSITQTYTVKVDYLKKNRITSLNRFI